VIKNSFLGALSASAVSFLLDRSNSLVPEDHEKAIREIPREPEVIELFKKLVGAGPLPPH